MKKFKLLTKVMEFASKHEVGIRAGAIIGSTLAAVYFAAKDSPRLMKELDELNVAGATNLEKAKAIAPIIAPTVVATGISVGMTLGSAKKVSDLVATVSTLSSAYSMTKTAQEEFIEKAKEVVGEEKVQEIKRAVADEKYPEKTSNGSYVKRVIRTGHGEDLFYLPFSDDWFLSDVHYVRNVGQNVKSKALGSSMVFWNEFACDLGIPSKQSQQGLAWTDDAVQFKLGDDELLSFDAGIDESNKVYTIVDLNLEPEFTKRRY